MILIGVELMAMLLGGDDLEGAHNAGVRDKTTGIMS